MNSHYVHLKLDYNKNLLRFLAEEDKDKAEPFTIKDRSKLQYEWFAHTPTWRLLYKWHWHKEIDILRQQFTKMFDTKVNACLVHQLENTELPWHRDAVEQSCTIQMLLSDNPEPITFRDIGDVYYECAMFDVSNEHMVKPGEERLLLKYQIYYKTYEECYEQLPDSLKT